MLPTTWTLPDPRKLLNRSDGFLSACAVAPLIPVAQAPYALSLLALLHVRVSNDSPVEPSLPEHETASRGGGYLKHITCSFRISTLSESYFDRVLCSICHASTSA